MSPRPISLKAAARTILTSRRLIKVNRTRKPGYPTPGRLARVNCTVPAHLETVSNCKSGAL
jgi:hypothetical protein